MLGPVPQTASCLRASPRQRGSALIEGLIAVLIFSLGILALVGLQASTTKAVSQGKARVDASFIADQRIGQIWLDMGNIANYSESGTSVSALPEGKRTTVIEADKVTVTITWRMPGEEADNSFQAIARINGN